MTTLPRYETTEALYRAGLEENALREDYSGRAMYGDKCFGIVGSPGDATAFLLELAETSPVLAKDLARAARTDSMGLSMITYYPGFTVEEE